VSSSTCSRCKKVAPIEQVPKTGAYPLNGLPIGWVVVTVGGLPERQHSLCPSCASGLTSWLSRRGLVDAT
jgi:hypothetical protein